MKADGAEEANNNDSQAARLLLIVIIVIAPAEGILKNALETKSQKFLVGSAELSVAVERILNYQSIHQDHFPIRTASSPSREDF